MNRRCAVESPDLPPEELPGWLRTPAGQHVTGGGELERHFDDSGVFAEVLPDGSERSAATWPDPGIWDIEDPAWWTTAGM
jgi:hypothetical protein